MDNQKQEWQNRLAFLDGIVHIPEEDEAPPPAERKRKKRITQPLTEAVPVRPDKSKFLRKLKKVAEENEKEQKVKDAVQTITDDIVTTLLRNEAVFVATKYYEQARKLMKGEGDPDEATVTLVDALLQKTIEYFSTGGRGRDVQAVQYMQMNWLQRYGNEQQKRQAQRIARRLRAKG